MERRKFLKISSMLSATPLFAKTDNRLFFKFPKKPFEYYYLKSKNPKFKIMLIGGIHGNEPGAYKAADMLINATLKKGEMLIIPRSNFTSILADVRGYNGDMNRKFASISKKDPDYYYVELLKSAILEYKPDVLISMHDGYGFYIKNKRAWGQSIVIDELKYKNFNLFSEANFIKNHANIYLKYKLGVNNTKTFSSHIHDEQKKALTGWCLENGIKAFCIEASKQLPTLEEKIKTHLVILREFFKLYDVEVAEMDEMINNPKKFIDDSNPVVEIEINGKKEKIYKAKNIKVPKGSEIIIKNINGSRGSFVVGNGINLNWKSFHARRLSIAVKNDFEKKYNIRIWS